MMDFSAQVRAFATQYPVEHVARSGVYINGIWESTDLPPVLLSDVAVQPLSGKEMSMLPEGYRDKKSLKFYMLQAIDTDDFLLYRGESYKVITVEPYDNIGDYFVHTAAEDQL